MEKISSSQLKRLQTLYNAYARRDMDPRVGLRSQRLLWASQACKRPVASFSVLTRDEANDLIDTLQISLGQPIEPPRHRPTSQYAATSAGLEGRRGDNGPKTMVTQASLDRIRRGYERMGWDEYRFTAWLQSSSGPLKGRTEIRTEWDANRVWWALKPMLKRAGVWKERVTA